jgi:exonuclease III
MKFIIFIICTLLLFSCDAQIKSGNGKRGDYRFMFYNVENLFDTYNDSITKDDDFTPAGKYKWTYERYQNKLNNIYKVIAAIGGWEPPEIIGVCEIENRRVLNDLLNSTPLHKTGYEIIHKESPDERGIDVALLYLRKKFKPVSYKAIPVNFSGSPNDKTRDILMVKGIINKQDTLHIFICHFPSRSGGQVRTEPARIFVASLLRSKVDSVFALNRKAKIIIMGDLNDDPDDRSITGSLKAGTSFEKTIPAELYNMSYLLFKMETGTLKYQDKWNLFDQIIVSGSLLDKTGAVYTQPYDAHIFNAEFLLEKDPDGGMQLFRTFKGIKYKGGFSDHLPVYIDLWRK